MWILPCFNFCDSVICRILSISCKDFYFNRVPIFFLSTYVFLKYFFVILIISFTSCLSSSKTLTYIPLFSLSNHGLFFSLLHTFMYLCTYSCFHRYKQLYLYNFAYTHVFMVHYLVLDSQLVYSSIGKTISPTINIPWLG